MVHARRKAAGGGELSYANLGEVHQGEIRNRLARIEGHLKGLGRQMEAGAECHELLMQASAIRSSLSGLMAKLLEAHIDTCVLSCARKGKGEEALAGLKAALTMALRQI
ncbi:MAG: metal-sensitive transcriptional regulator [Acidobacteria bacterium]|nr:metal-sensitive transcriptional regulator [Acidobacteriota bacterium]